MTSTSHTKLNDGESPIFSEPIPNEIPRRQFDRKLLEAYDADHERIRAMSSRLTRIEAAFESFTRDLSKLDQRQGEILSSLEKTAENLTLIGNRLAIHTEMEEYQWSVLNTSNKTLAEIGTTLSQHLQECAGMNSRLRWIEKTTWGLWGAAAAAGAALVPYALMGMRGE